MSALSFHKRPQCPIVQTNYLFTYFLISINDFVSFINLRISRAFSSLVEFTRRFCLIFSEIVPSSSNSSSSFRAISILASESRIRKSYNSIKSVKNRIPQFFPHFILGFIVRGTYNKCMPYINFIILIFIDSFIKQLIKCTMKYRIWLIKLI